MRRAGGLRGGVRGGGRQHSDGRGSSLSSDAVTMAQQCSSPGIRRRSDGSVRESLFFPVSERNKQERLESLVRKRGGAGQEAWDLLENRPKRWTWGGPPDGAEVGDFLSPPTMDPPISKQLSNSSAVLPSLDRTSPNNHRLYRSSSNRRSIAGLPEETSGSRTPTGESPNPLGRSSSFRTSTPKRVWSNRSRAQSPCSPDQYPSSPLRQRVTTPDDRSNTEVKGNSTLERKSLKPEMSERKIPKSTSKELSAESPGTWISRNVAGTTDAEEASRILTEKRRQARIQKETEERHRQEEDRLKAEEEQKKQQEAREKKEREVQQAEEERARREEERRSREEEERLQKEQRWKDMQEQLDREREEAFIRAQKEAERKRQERELLHLQEEQERLQRKKRIEEIMKRTRRGEAEPVAAAASEDDVPDIMLGPLENRSCVDELSDGVQSMDVSPVSRDDQASPLMEGTDPSPLDHLMDAQEGGGQCSEMPPYLRQQLGDFNKNLLIQACSAASDSSHFIHSKLDVQ